MELAKAYRQPSEPATNKKYSPSELMHPIPLLQLILNRHLAHLSSREISDETFCFFFGEDEGACLLVRLLLSSPVPLSPPAPPLPAPAPLFFCEALEPQLPS
jgi:hypothetical protein